MKKFLFLKIFLLTLYSPTIFAITCSTGSGGSSGSYSWSKATDSAEFRNRHSHSSVEFEDKIWVIGGGTFDSARNNDVWSSTDGKTWNKVTDAAAFSQRTNYQAVVFNDGTDERIYVIGGTINGGNTNDVWSSTNGATWHSVKPNNSDGFSARQSFTAVVFNDGTGEKIYVIGGDNSSVLNDVWSSTDGKTWKEETKNSSKKFTARQNHSSVNFNDKLWVIGGVDSSNSKTNSVWKSDNGKDWDLVTDNAEFDARHLHQSVVFDNKMWVIAGSGEASAVDNKNDVWNSTDGKKWNRVTDDAGFDARARMSSVVFNNKVFLIGGLGAGIFKDVWSMEID